MKLMMAINSAISAARQAFAGGEGSLDNKRPTAWCTYGYPAEVTFQQMRTAYERRGAAHGAVERVLGKCWSKYPRIKLNNGDEKENQWEKDLKAFFGDKKLKVWKNIIEADRRGMVGHYSAIIYQVADNKKWNEPLDTATRLVKLIPCWEDEITAVAWDMDQASERYGEPTMWSYTEDRPEDRANQAKVVTNIHWTRVQEIRYRPFLKAGINSLIDMEKVSGGSAESFLKNSARTVVVEFDVDADPQGTDAQGNPIKVRDMLNEQFAALNTNTDAALGLQGAKATTLQTTVSDPTGPWTVPANEFSASIQVPFTIVFGQQTGRLASDQDQKDMAIRCGSRQTNDITPVLEEFVGRFQLMGIIEKGDFIIEWADLLEPSDKDRLDKAKTMADTNKTMFDAGDDPAYTQEEIRRAADYAPMTIERPVVTPPAGGAV